MQSFSQHFGFLKHVVGRCAICEIAKLKQKSCPKQAENKALKILERVCADTSGMKAITTLSGFRGFSVVIDEK
jgi:hypothetical protein